MQQASRLPDPWTRVSIACKIRLCSRETELSSRISGFGLRPQQQKVLLVMVQVSSAGEQSTNGPTSTKVGNEPRRCCPASPRSAVLNLLSLPSSQDDSTLATSLQLCRYTRSLRWLCFIHSCWLCIHYSQSAQQTPQHSRADCSPQLYSTISPHAHSPADNLPWPTIYSLARETEISEPGEILLHAQCRRDGRSIALASRR